MRILLAEDDPTLREFVTRGLTEAGYAVDAVANGEDAWLAAKLVHFDVAILDINMPGLDGFEVCRRVRAHAAHATAVLFLTARDGVCDRVAGLDLGAEDYLVKPFAFAELLARVRALLRRGAGAAPVLKVGALRLDPATRRVTHGERDVRLSAKEFAVLEYLMRNVGRVVTRHMIVEHVWNFALEAESNFIEVFIYALRKKLAGPDGQQLIQTVRGAGYRLAAPPVA